MRHNQEKSSVLTEQLKTGHLDAAFLSSPVSEPDLMHTHLFDEPFLLAMDRHHLLSKKKFIRPDDLVNYTLLLLEEGHCLRDQALSFCRKINTTEVQNFRATSLETLRNMVTAGVGMTLMPRLACLPRNDICYVPFAKPVPSRSIALFWRETSARKTVLKEIAGEVKTMIH